MLSVTKIEFDIIILTECWLQLTGPLPQLQGYTSYHTIKNPIKNDGVVIYAKSTLDCLTFEPMIRDANCLVCCYNNTAIIAVYRSPSYQDASNFYSSLCEIVTSVKSYCNITLIGDINIDIKPGNSDRHSNDYLTTMATLGLLPAHTLPTRINNCLDHILLRTQSPARVIVLNSHVTDHLPVALFIDLKGYKSTFKKSLIRHDYESIKTEIDNFDFATGLCIQDPEIATNFLVDYLQKVLIKHSKTVYTSNRKTLLKPWMTVGLVRCLRHRDEMHRKAKAQPDNLLLKVSYNRYRNFCNALLRKLKRAYEKSQLLKAKNNPKATWKVIKNITNNYHVRQSSSALLKLKPDPIASINNVNNFFVNIGKNLATKFSPHSLGTASIPSPSPLNSLVIPLVDEEQVICIIQSLRSECAVGWDYIPAKILRQSSRSLAPIITHICNCAINSGIFPKAFKRAVVHPIYKAGVRDDVSNYRPISVLSALSKILERILNNSLTKFLAKNNILSPKQYGFRTGISTEDAVLDFVNSLVDKLDNRFKCYGIFLDLTKAFDTVSIPRLVAKMEHIGIRGLPLDIFKSYLSGRSQCVKIEDIISAEEPICYGIPQGSILGPTLFQIYINDLCQLPVLHCDIFTYADDTALLIYDSDWSKATDRVEASLRSIVHWLTNNMLTLNITKTKIIQFSSSNCTKPPTTTDIIPHVCTDPTQCKCVSLSLVPHIKYLGVHIDEKLDWRTHIDALCSRLRKLIYLFKDLRHSADKETSTMVYRSLCESIITYCIPVWGGTFKTAMLRAERAQRAVLKVMSFKKQIYPTRQLYSEAQVLTVRQLYILRTVLRRHTMLPLSSEATSRRTGFPVCKVTKCRTALASRHFCALSSKIYNRVNKSISIYKLTLYKAKQILRPWLQSLSYDDTEKLILSVS